MTDIRQLPELYQAEWCPSSRQVRTRLTELQIEVVMRQVEPEAEQRTTMRDRTDSDSIPTLVLADGGMHVGTEEIMQYLDTTWRGGEPASVAAHRDKAERVRIKQAEKHGHSA